MRQAIRRKASGPASMSIHNGSSSIDCDVLDWSDYGARLRPLNVATCPEKFTLITKDGGRFDCLVVWRHDERIGVKFL